MKLKINLAAFLLINAMGLNAAAQLPSQTPTQTNVAQTPSNKYPPLTASQAQEFNELMNAEVIKQNKFVQDLVKMVEDKTRAPMTADKLQLEAATTALEVKKIIVTKFTSSPSLKSQKVRNALKSILSEPFISEADLASLQSITDAERTYTYP